MCDMFCRCTIYNRRYNATAVVYTPPPREYRPQSFIGFRWTPKPIKFGERDWPMLLLLQPGLVYTRTIRTHVLNKLLYTSDSGGPRRV